MGYLAELALLVVDDLHVLPVGGDHAAEGLDAPHQFLVLLLELQGRLAGWALGLLQQRISQVLLVGWFEQAYFADIGQQGADVLSPAEAVTGLYGLVLVWV